MHLFISFKIKTPQFCSIKTILFNSNLILNQMKTIITLAVAAAIAIVVLNQCQNAEANNTSETISTNSVENAVKRGAYLVNAMGCDDCHTPKKMTEIGPEPDMDKRLMGHPSSEEYLVTDKKDMALKQNVAVFSAGMTAIAGPWGVSYAANLTPDDTGIGTWTEAQFMKAIREGKSKGLDGARPLLPPMPWQVYRNLTEDDLKAIFAFLKSIKPQQNVVPNPKGW
jgi:hypothetical protein